MLWTRARVGSARMRQSLTVICIRPDRIHTLFNMKAAKRTIIMKLKIVTTKMMTTTITIPIHLRIRIL